MSEFLEQNSVLTVSVKSFEDIEEASRRAFEKGIADLSYDEAAQLIGAVVLSTSKGKFSEEGRVVVDSKLDGDEAFSAVTRKHAHEIAPRIDDDREVVINVTRNLTLLEFLLHRDPKILRSYRYRNEPAQYA